MNNPIQERHHYSGCSGTVKVFRRMQNSAIYMANGRFRLEFSSTDLEHIFGSNTGNEFGVISRGNWPPKSEIVYGIVRIRSFVTYTDLMEYKIVGDTKTLFLQCFPLIKKLKSGDIITTEQNLNYHTFSRLRFRRLLKSSFHSVHTWEIWEAQTLKNTQCIHRYHSICFDVWKTSNIPFQPVCCFVGFRCVRSCRDC